VSRALSDRTPVVEAVPAPPAAAGTRSPLVAGLAAGAWAAVLGAAVVTVPVVAVWASSRSDPSGPGAPVRLGLWLFLLGTHARLDTPAGPLTVAPLGLLALTALVLYRSGRWAGRTVPATPVDAVLTAATLALTFVTAACALAVAVRSGGYGPTPASVLAAGLCLALIAGGAGVAVGAALSPPRPRPQVAAAGVGAVGGLATLVAAGGVLTAVSLTAHATTLTAASGALAGGALGGLSLVLAQLVVLPNVVVWAAALSTGVPAHLGALAGPGGLPVLTGLDGGSLHGAAAVVAALAPITAGVVVAALVRRRLAAADGGEPTTRTAMLAAGAAGVAAGTLLGVLAALAAGGVGHDHLAHLGAAPALVTLAAASEVGLAAALAAAVAPWVLPTARAVSELGAHARTVAGERLGGRASIRAARAWGDEPVPGRWGSLRVRAGAAGDAASGWLRAQWDRRPFGR